MAKDLSDIQDFNESTEELSQQKERFTLRKLLSLTTDLTSVSIPVSYNEPLTFLQRMMDYLLYNDLLTKASKTKDPYLRLLYVSIFSITCYSGSDRKVKPFNPFIGETYEYIDKIKNLYFVSEQVSHHPPVGASHCETDDWIYYQTQTVNTKLLGNSLDVTPSGTSHVIFKKHNEHYTWSNIKIVIHNIIIGRIWIDFFGELKIDITDHITKEKLPLSCVIDFKKCGWIGKNWNKVEGHVFDQDQKHIKIVGKWNEQIGATALNNQVFKDQSTGIEINSNDEITWIWKEERGVSDNLQYAKYDWSDYTVKLTSINDEILSYIPLTDSRLRKDRLYLERGKMKEASACKKKFEDAQRLREKNQSSYKPKYFVQGNLENYKNNLFEKDIWYFNNTYWNVRKERHKRYYEENERSSLKAATNYWNSCGNIKVNNDLSDR